MRGSEHKKLGCCWGTTGLYFVETSLTVPQKMFFAPFPQSSQGNFRPSKILPESMHFIASLQHNFQQNQITPGITNLSLPANEIIFRTFVIPWMKATEVMGVVSYEAIKYIPFSLKIGRASCRERVCQYV